MALLEVFPCEFQSKLSAKNPIFLNLFLFALVFETRFSGCVLRQRTLISKNRGSMLRSNVKKVKNLKVNKKFHS